MIVISSVLAALAAALHVFIWYLESFAWTGRARAVFGTTLEEAEATREMAFNQGYYNLFLAIVTAAGLVAWARDARSVGTALVVAGCGSMLAAAALLFATSPDKRSAAVRQGTLPLLALVALAVASL